MIWDDDGGEEDDDGDVVDDNEQCRKQAECRDTEERRCWTDGERDGCRQWSVQHGAGRLAIAVG